MRPKKPIFGPKRVEQLKREMERWEPRPLLIPVIDSAAVLRGALSRMGVSDPEAFLR